MEARRKDPQAQLLPEINVDIKGEDHQEKKVLTSWQATTS
jgi:hypothetical protein